MPKQTLKQFMVSAEQYIKKYPEELMKVLEEVSKREEFTLGVENGEFVVYYTNKITKHVESYFLPYAVTVLPKERITVYSMPFHYIPLEELKKTIARLKKEESEKGIKANKIRFALSKLTDEEKQLLNVTLYEL